MEYTLTMTFITENNTFDNKKGAFVSKQVAQLTERQVTKFTV